ncbi:MAG: UspA [Armatimonadetes bacterium]|jgi:nucleotide-binding universal stress UspA family protein|nr:UspA [Armatimonadota bacterium]
MRRILVGFDGSEAARRALDQACGLARQFGAALTVLTGAADRIDLRQAGTHPALDFEPGRQLAEEGARLARERGVSPVEARTSIEAPDDALVLEAHDGYDLVVVGHQGAGGLRERLLGSVAKSVVDRAPCSVLVAR